MTGSLRLASYNIHKCVGTDRRFDPVRIAAVIAEMDPDIIALQEVDTRFGIRRGLLDLDSLREATGLIPVPLTLVSVSHGFHGNLILFKQGMVSSVHETRLPGLEPRGALMAEFDLGPLGPLRVIAAHLGLVGQSRRSQASTILNLIGLRSDMPTILAGDLNEWRYDQKSSLNELQRAFGAQPAPVASFPSRLPLLALDRIIANRPGMLKSLNRHESALSRVASDHLPLFAELSMSPETIRP